MNLGYLQSSTEIIVEIWDKDGGLEFADDRLTRGKVKVPFCSSFSSYAHNVQETCDETFGCSVDDSLWAMPQRKRCNETGSIMFSNSQSCDSPGAVCLFLEIIIVPFVMKVCITSPFTLSFRRKNPTHQPNSLHRFIHLTLFYISFQMNFQVELAKPGPFLTVPVITAAAPILTSANTAPWTNTNKFGFPFQNDLTTLQLTWSTAQAMYRGA